MRHTLAAITLVLAIAVPASGAPTVALPYKLAADSVPAPWFTSGIVAGRFGGVPVIGSFRGTSSLGVLTLTTHKATFAFGSYACAHGVCSFTGVVAGLRVRRIALPLNLRGAGRLIAGVLPTRRAWLSAVATWARLHLTREQRDTIIAEVEKATGT
ncbi:MAG TPA: hypothetical protein VKV57_10820 [bacterium]|nr:hypothetical protein [bacterium]